MSHLLSKTRSVVVGVWRWFFTPNCMTHSPFKTRYGTVGLFGWLFTPNCMAHLSSKARSNAVGVLGSYFTSNCMTHLSSKAGYVVGATLGFWKPIRCFTPNDNALGCPARCFFTLSRIIHLSYKRTRGSTCSIKGPEDDWPIEKRLDGWWSLEKILSTTDHTILFFFSYHTILFIIFLLFSQEVKYLYRSHLTNITHSLRKIGRGCSWYGLV